MEAYLDNSATTCVYQETADLVCDLMVNHYGNPSAMHQKGVEAEQYIRTAQETLAKILKVKEKEIYADENGAYNFLLEGDNLHSLYLLEKTHRGKIDVIYIDPPYNTGSKDFVYDDEFVVKEDGFRHSKWLSFMAERLRIAKKLISNNGFIFISIDDSEVAQLKLLCNEIIGENNFRGQIVRGTGTPTGQGNAIISNEIDYILVYAISNTAFFNGLPFDDKSSKIYNLEDEYGHYLLRPLRKTGGEDKREDRPTMYYPVFAPDGTEVFPVAPSGYDSRWRCQESTYLKLEKDILQIQ